jgi:hypothetical protein
VAAKEAIQAAESLADSGGILILEPDAIVVLIDVVPLGGPVIPDSSVVRSEEIAQLELDDLLVIAVTRDHVSHKYPRLTQELCAILGAIAIRAGSVQVGARGLEIGGEMINIGLRLVKVGFETVTLTGQLRNAGVQTVNLRRQSIAFRLGGGQVSLR